MHCPYTLICFVEYRIYPIANFATFLHIEAILKAACNICQRRAHSKITSHFIRRCITLGCVAKARNIQIFLRFRALPKEHLNA